MLGLCDSKHPQGFYRQSIVIQFWHGFVFVTEILDHFYFSRFRSQQPVHINLEENFADFNQKASEYCQEKNWNTGNPGKKSRDKNDFEKN